MCILPKQIRNPAEVLCRSPLIFSQIVARLGYSTVKTNLWTVAPNAVGFVFLLCVTKSSDYFRERTFHICFALAVSLVGMIILAAIDVLHNKGGFGDPVILDNLESMLAVTE